MQPASLNLNKHAAARLPACLPACLQASKQPGYVPPPQRPDVAFLPRLLDEFLATLDAASAETEAAAVAAGERCLSSCLKVLERRVLRSCAGRIVRLGTVAFHVCNDTSCNALHIVTSVVSEVVMLGLHAYTICPNCSGGWHQQRRRKWPPLVRVEEGLQQQQCAGVLRAVRCAARGPADPAAYAQVGGLVGWWAIVWVGQESIM
jgi:hypothetical protein